MFALLADLVLISHFALVLFITGGLFAVWLGYWLHWGFIRNFWFRTVHLICIAVVAAQTLGGLWCPLTIWEDRLRRLAGQETVYEGSFLAYWLHRIMFFHFPPVVFTSTYLAFFLLVLLSFIFIRPRRPALLFGKQR